MSKQGFIKLYRQIQDHWIYEEKRKFSKFEAWTFMLMQANHKDNKFILGNEMIDLKKGQFVTSELKLMERFDWGKAKLRSFLEMLAKDEMIVKISDRKKTIITICNYSVFHETKTENRPLADHEQTTSRPLADTNKNVNNVLEEKELKPNNKNGTEKIIDYWDKNGFGFTSISAKNKLLMFLDEGTNEDVILKALEIAVDMNKTSYAYVEKVLIDWSKRGVKTISDVEALQKEFELQKQKPRQGFNKKPIRTEIVPDYMDETPQTMPPMPSIDLDAKKRAIEEKLKAFRGEST